MPALATQTEPGVDDGLQAFEIDGLAAALAEAIGPGLEPGESVERLDQQSFCVLAQGELRGLVEGGAGVIDQGVSEPKLRHAPGFEVGQLGFELAAP